MSSPILSGLILTALTFGVAGASAQPRPTLDVPYVEDASPKQHLDLYTPEARDFPTLVFVHGGSLTSGDRKDEPHAEICGTFSRLGVGCAAASYRLADDAPWPAQPRDVAAAFAWTKRSIAERGGDPARVFLFGHSSGCHLSALVSSDPRYLAERGLSQTDVAGVVALGCRLNDVVVVADDPPESYETSAIRRGLEGDYAPDPPYQTLAQRNGAVPARHVSAGLPPTLVLVAEGERFFPPVLRDGAEFVGRALQAGAEADLVVLPDRRHVSVLEEMVSPDDPTVQTVLGFVRAH